MEMFQLRYFEAVVRRGSLTAAAADCHISQPSLSMQIKNLEAELGVQLLERKARGVVPTPAGRRLMLTTRRLLTELEVFHGDVRRRNFAGPPEVRIGIQPFLAATMLARPLARYLGGKDAYQIIVRELPHHRLAEALESRAIDLSLSAMPRAVPAQVSTQLLFDLRYRVFCPRGHPLARLKAPRLRDLLSHPLVLFNDPANLVERVSQLGESLRQPARIILSSDQALTVFEMVAAGLGVAVLPAVMQERARRRKLVVLPLADRGLHLPVLAAWNRDRTLPPEVESFLAAFSRAVPAQKD